MSSSTLQASLRFVALVSTLLILMPSSVLAASCVPDSESNLEAITSVIGAGKGNLRNQAGAADEAKGKAEAQPIASEEKLQKEIKLLEEEITRLSDKLETAFDDVDTLLARARLRKQLGHRREAIEDYTKVIAAQGESPELLAERGEVWTSLNEFAKAEADLNQAVKLAPTDPNIYYARGKVFIEQWKTRDAYGDFSKAIELDPQHKLARYERAYLLVGVSSGYGNVKAAAADLAIVVELDPELDKARFTYAHALWGVNKNEEAIRQADIYLQRNPESECMYVLRSKAYRSLQKYDLALRDALRYIAFDPQDDKRYYLTAHIYTDSGDYPHAVADWTRYISVRPESVPARLNRARSYEYLNRYEEAIADWDALVRLQPHNPDWLRFRSVAEAHVYRYDAALEDLQAAYKLSDHKGAVNGSLENLYRDMGETSKAYVIQQATKRSVRHSEAKRNNQTPEESDQAILAELTERIDQAIAEFKVNKQFRRDAFQLHAKDEVWGGLWLKAFAELLSEKDPKGQIFLMDSLRSFLERSEHYPYPKAETDQLVAALKRLAENGASDKIRFQAKTFAKVFAELQIYNNPETTIYQAGALPYDLFTYPEDEKGRSGKFTRLGGMWLESKERLSNGRFKEIARTPEHIDLLNVGSGIYVRLEPTKALWSHDRKNWKLIGNGEFSMRR